VGKYIRKISRDEKKNHHNEGDSSEEEWSHVTDVNEKSEDNPLSPQEKIIEFSNQFSNETKEEVVKEKTEQIKDQMSNTNQYLKFANELIKEKMSKIKQIQEDEKRFQEQVELLQNKLKSKFELDQLNPKYVTENDARNIIYHLEEEFEKMKDRLLFQELIVQKTKDEITSKRKQIQQVKDELKIKTQPEQNEGDPITILKEELKKAGITDESSPIFEAINKISEFLNSARKLEQSQT
jgi:hypothetical protein